MGICEEIDQCLLITRMGESDQFIENEWKRVGVCVCVYVRGADLSERTVVWVEHCKKRRKGTHSRRDEGEREEKKREEREIEEREREKRKREKNEGKERENETCN